VSPSPNYSEPRKTNFKAAEHSGNASKGWSKKADNNFAIDKNIFIVLFNNNQNILARDVLLQPIVFKKIKNIMKNKKTEVYRILKQRIIKGTLAPGLPINEIDLASDLRVSKTPLREALRQLEREGFVTTTPGRGSTVAPITFQDIREIYEMREIIECSAAKRGALRCDKNEVRESKRQLERMLGKDPTPRSFPWGEVENVHQLIIRSVGNQKLFETYIGIIDHIKRIRIQFLNRFALQRHDELIREHIQILDAFIDGDGEKAELAVQTHLRNAAAHFMGLS
jgi:DNA-binding GntR family transcriptional regulator